MSRSTIPGLPGHQPDAPSSADLHRLDHQAAQLARTWHQLAEVAQEARHQGVPLAEALEYHCFGALLFALIESRFPGQIEAAREQRRD